LDVLNNFIKKFADNKVLDLLCNRKPV